MQNETKSEPRCSCGSPVTTVYGTSRLSDLCIQCEELDTRITRCSQAGGGQWCGHFGGTPVKRPVRGGWKVAQS